MRYPLPLARLSLLLLIVVSAPPARADSSTAEPATVPQIDEAALLARLGADPRLGLIAADLEEARAAVSAAARAPNPIVAYDGERVGESSKDELRLSFPIEISGRRGARRAAARAEARAVAAEAEAARWDVIVEGLRVFREAQYQRSRHGLLLAERAKLASAVEVVRKRSAAGATSGYDLQRVELELARYDDELVEAAAALELARAELGALLAAPGGVDAAGALELPGEPAALPSSLAELPEARAAAAREEAARESLRGAARAWIPSLVVAGGALRQRAKDEREWGYVAGVAFELPLFDRGQVERAQARASAQRAHAARQRIDGSSALLLRGRRDALVQARLRARALDDLAAARLPQLLRSAEATYRDGGEGERSSIVELIDAYTSARDVRLRALQLRRDAHAAQLAYWSALGSRP